MKKLFLLTLFMCAGLLSSCFAGTLKVKNQSGKTCRITIRKSDGTVIANNKLLRKYPAINTYNNVSGSLTIKYKHKNSLEATSTVSVGESETKTQTLWNAADYCS
jgi:hypothetical protein